MKIAAKLLPILTILLAASCIDDNDTSTDNSGKIKIIGTGDIVSKGITVDAFNSIQNVGVINVYFTQGNTRKVVLKAQQNILDVMKYSVSGNELVLSFDDNVSISTSKEISAEITNPDLTSINIVGTGNIELNGSGQSKLIIVATGTGNINAYNFPVDTCYITMTGTGWCKVNVNKLLHATMTGIGSVYYKGHPEIHTSITGLGSVVDDN
jgi:hypothetical protein